MSGFDAGDVVVVVAVLSEEAQRIYGKSFMAEAEARLGHVGRVSRIDEDDDVLEYRVDFEDDVDGSDFMWVERRMIQRVREDEL